MSKTQRKIHLRERKRRHKLQGKAGKCSITEPSFRIVLALFVRPTGAATRRTGTRGAWEAAVTNHSSPGTCASGSHKPTHGRARNASAKQHNQCLHAYLEVAIGVDEHIAGLQVAVQNVCRVDVLHPPTTAVIKRCARFAFTPQLLGRADMSRRERFAALKAAYEHKTKPRELTRT